MSKYVSFKLPVYVEDFIKSLMAALENVLTSFMRALKNPQLFCLNMH